MDGGRSSNAGAVAGMRKSDLEQRRRRKHTRIMTTMTRKAFIRLVWFFSAAGAASQELPCPSTIEVSQKQAIRRRVGTPVVTVVRGDP